MDNNTRAANSAVCVENVTVRFGETVANDDVSIDVHRGEVFALVGENGAGKSTIMNVLYGSVKPVSGSVSVNGKSIDLRNYSCKKAIESGVSMVHQHFMPVDAFTVAQNIFLGHEPKKFGIFFDEKRAISETKRLSEEYGLHVDANATVADLGVGMRQRVEILKALSRGSDILILDEPTAVLTPQETDELFDVIRNLVENKGLTVIIITHKLYEVMRVSDRVGVMRRGRVIGVCDTKDVNEKKLASMMVGRDILFDAIESKTTPGENALVTDKLTVTNSLGQVAVKNVSLAVRAGEILGIAGVEGNGQSELAQAIAGLRKISSGSVIIGGTHAEGLSPKKIRELGFSHIPEDRMETGLSPKDTVAANLVAGKQNASEFCSLGVVNKKSVNRYAEELFSGYDIRGEGVEHPVNSLSGGNMQKVVIAREFSFENTRVLLIDQPTRGVDVGATESIHALISKKRDEGCAILLISADLDEIMRLSDRIKTIFEGEITGEFSKGASKEEIGKAMLYKNKDGHSNE